MVPLDAETESLAASVVPAKDVLVTDNEASVALGATMLSLEVEEEGDSVS